MIDIKKVIEKMDTIILALGEIKEMVEAELTPEEEEPVPESAPSPPEEKKSDEELWEDIKKKTEKKIKDMSEEEKKEREEEVNALLASVMVSGVPKKILELSLVMKVHILQEIEAAVRGGQNIITAEGVREEFEKLGKEEEKPLEEDPGEEPVPTEEPPAEEVVVEEIEELPPEEKQPSGEEFVQGP